MSNMNNMDNMGNINNSENYKDCDVKISWDGILSVVMRKYLRYGIELEKLCLPKQSYDAIINRLNQKYGGSDNFVYGLSKNDSYDFFVTYPQWVESADCKGEDLLLQFKKDMIKIFFHWYDDDFLEEMKREGKINLHVYGKEDPDRPVWSVEDGESRVILQNVAWLSAVKYYEELQKERKEGKKENYPSEEKIKSDEEIREKMCEEVDDKDYHEPDKED